VVWLAGASGALASGWSIEPIANPPGYVGWGPGSVSCASPRDCIADGIATGPFGAVGHWDGVNWSIDQPLEALNASGSSALTPWVSCIPHRGCVAVGVNAPHGVGVRWSIPSFPTGIDVTYASSRSLSCASPTACTANGLSPVPAGQATFPHAVVERWNGRQWAIQRPVMVGSNDALGAVSCPSVTVCILVGSYNARGGTLILTERWNGTKWSLVRSPNPAQSHCYIEAGPTLPFCSGLGDVSCASPVACVAIGAYGDSMADLTLTERWNGKKWSIQRTPNVGPSILNGVSCSSATACTIVGIKAGGSVVEHWNGQRWSLQRTPTPPGAVLNDVSCPTPTSCTAVGEQQLATSGGPLAERWSGRG
jgi:hypothetical protein